MAAPYALAEFLSYLDHPKLGFWLLICFLANGTFGLIRAILDPDWYVSGALAAGVAPSFRNRILTKVLSLAVGLAIAWHVGSAAKFF
jgi:hypothetical protein